MPRRKSRNQKIANTMQDRAEKGIGTQSIATANKIKAAVQEKPYYGEIKPLIDCLEKEADYWKEKCVPVEEKQEEIEELQDALEMEVDEKETLQDKVKAKEEEVQDYEEQVAKTTKRLNKLVRKLKTYKSISAENAPKHTKLGTEERELLDRLLDGVSQLIPKSKGDDTGATSFDIARSIAVRGYCMLRTWGLGKKKARHWATAIVWASGQKYKAKVLMKQWIKELDEKGEFANNLRGERQAQHSLIHVLDVHERVASWCKEQRTVDPKRLRDWVNKSLLPDLGDMPFGTPKRPISKGTARRWLHRVGYVRKRKSKGAYTDGHDAPATLLARQEYIRQFRVFEPLMQRCELDENGNINLVEPDLESQAAKDTAAALGLDRPYVIVNVHHDEMTAKPADKGKDIWILLGDSALSPKSEGQGYMVSGFLTADGLLTVPGDAQMRDSAGQPVVDKDGNPVLLGVLRMGSETVVQTASMYWETGAKKDGYFSCDDLIAQLKEKMIPTFKARYPPDRYKGLVHFDNATSHTAFAKDALVAHKITVTDGCKTTPIMRATKWQNQDGRWHEQPMQLEDGRAKGMGRLDLLCAVGVAGEG